MQVVLGVDNTVKSVWVPVHVVIAGNQEADRLAKNGEKSLL